MNQLCNNNTDLQGVFCDFIFKDFTKEELSIVDNNKELLIKINNIAKRSVAYLSTLGSNSSNMYKISENIDLMENNNKEAFTLLFCSSNYKNLDSKYILSNEDIQHIKDIALELRPWRKGPFYLRFMQDSIKSSDEFYIDSEWQSNIKMKLILDALKQINYDLDNKEVLDVGCNNGYYMFDLALRGIKNITGIDPIAIFFLQFYFIYKLTNINNCFYRILGVQNIHKLNKKFDLVLCMGVLYHRKEPLSTLKQLRQSIKIGGMLLLETLILNDDKEICLCPYPTYAKMPNVYYIFSPKALSNLAFHAGFKTCELISFSYTDNKEQHTTDFIYSKSLGDFLHADSTIDGYPPACRGIFILS